MRKAIFALMIMLFTWQAFAAEPALVTGMSIKPDKTSSIITLNLSKKTSGTVQFVSFKNQLRVQFDNAKLRFKVQNAHLKNSNIKSMSAKQFSDHRVKFYFNTDGKVTWDTRFIPVKGGQHVKFELQVHSKTKSKAKAAAKVTNKVVATVAKKKIVRVKQKERKPVGRERWKKHKEKVANKRAKPFTIIIDPGHGGKDSGAVGTKGTKEKDVVLKISKRLAKKIKRIPGVRVVMTRTTDKYIPLRGRLDIARKYEGDLFIAVHADAYFNKSIRGSSVYALSQHGATSEAARWLAKRENHAGLDDIDFKNLPDNSRMLRSMLIDMAQTVTIRDSLRLGNKVLDALDGVSKLRFKHVEQAPFVVLKSPDIPSILIETGFISNPYEETKLSNPRYQEKIAMAIYTGVRSYVKTRRR